MSTFKGDDAPSQQHAEDVESQIAKPDLHPQNGDAVAQMIGAQHIEVTEEDVRSFILLRNIGLTFLRTNASVERPTNTSSPSSSGSTSFKSSINPSSAMAQYGACAKTQTSAGTNTPWSPPWRPSHNSSGSLSLHG